MSISLGMDIEIISYTTQSGENVYYLTEDIANGRIRRVAFEEVFARAYGSNADWYVKGLDTYALYHETARKVGAIKSSTAGIFREGVTLSAGAVTGDPSGMPSNPKYAYQWFRNNTAVSGATARTYKVPTGRFGTYRVAVTYTDGQGFRSTISSQNQMVGRILRGTSRADILRGTTGDDLITGLGGADRLTGGAGRDTFRYTNLSESRLAAYDRITDFAIGTDRLDAPRAVTAANVRQLGRVSALTQNGISAVLTRATFQANRAATFTLGTGARTRTFLALNDGIAGFDGTRDGLIEITGFSGNLTNLAII
jgi:serralysin